MRNISTRKARGKQIPRAKSSASTTGVPSERAKKPAEFMAESYQWLRDFLERQREAGHSANLCHARLIIEDLYDDRSGRAKRDGRYAGERPDDLEREYQIAVLVAVCRQVSLVVSHLSGIIDVEDGIGWADAIVAGEVLRIAQLLDKRVYQLHENVIGNDAATRAGIIENKIARQVDYRARHGLAKGGAK